MSTPSKFFDEIKPLFIFELKYLIYNLQYKPKDPDDTASEIEYNKIIDTNYSLDSTIRTLRSYSEIFKTLEDAETVHSDLQYELDKADVDLAAYNKSVKDMQMLVYNNTCRVPSCLTLFCDEHYQYNGPLLRLIKEAKDRKPRRRKRPTKRLSNLSP